MWAPLHFKGSYWNVAEDELDVIAAYYRLQARLPHPTQTQRTFGRRRAAHARASTPVAGTRMQPRPFMHTVRSRSGQPQALIG